jgi:hypothetical protein
VIVLDDTNVAGLVFANDEMIGLLDAPRHFGFALRVDDPGLIHIVGGVDGLL